MLSLLFVSRKSLKVSSVCGMGETLPSCHMPHGAQWVLTMFVKDALRRL